MRHTQGVERGCTNGARRSRHQLSTAIQIHNRRECPSRTLSPTLAVDTNRIWMGARSLRDGPAARSATLLQRSNLSRFKALAPLPKPAHQVAGFLRQGPLLEAPRKPPISRSKILEGAPRCRRSSFHYPRNFVVHCNTPQVGGDWHCCGHNGMTRGGNSVHAPTCSKPLWVAPRRCELSLAHVQAL